LAIVQDRKREAKLYAVMLMTYRMRDFEQLTEFIFTRMTR